MKRVLKAKKKESKKEIVISQIKNPIILESISRNSLIDSGSKKENAKGNQILKMYVVIININLT